MAQTPLTVGSPQQVIDRTLGFREFVGDYQRQLFLADHAGLPLKIVLEQMDILATRSCRSSAASSLRCGRAGRPGCADPASPRARPAATRRPADAPVAAPATRERRR